eukprot:2497354-Prymnesium_polylepis.1
MPAEHRRRRRPANHTVTSPTLSMASSSPRDAACSSVRVRARPSHNQSMRFATDEPTWYATHAQ